jgi:hypothetical protein
VTRARRREFDADFVRAYTYEVRVSNASALPRPLSKRLQNNEVIAQAECDLLLVDSAAEQGLNPIEVADEYSSELLEVTEALVDMDGMPTELARLESAGDLLYVANLAVDPAFEFGSVARVLLEAVVKKHWLACMAVAYLLESFEAPQVRSVLEEREFIRVPAWRQCQKWTRVYAADTKLVRREL